MPQTKKSDSIIQKTLRSYEDLRWALDQLVHRKAREDLLTYTRLWGPRIVPDFKMGRHIEVICHKLQSVIEAEKEGKPKRIMIFLPPRSTKSVLCSKIFPSFYIGHFPQHELLAVSHSDELATDFGRTVRDIVNSDEYQQIFPAIRLRQDVKAAGKWMTNKNGQYFAAGVRTKIAGRGAHCAMLDDALSEEAAMSEAGKRYIKKWYPSGIRTRMMPNGSIIIINTRYAYDDLCGWLLAQETEHNLEVRWEVVSIPAWLDEPASELLGLPVGTSYFPEWKPDEVLRLDEAEIKASEGSRYWESLYMQRPQAEEGGIIKDKWMMNWPHEEAPAVDMIIQTMDTAFSTRETADESVLHTWGVFHLMGETPDGYEVPIPNIILLGNEHGRMEYPDLRELTKEAHKEWDSDLIIIEKKASGQSLIQDMKKASLPVFEYMPDRDKVARLYAASPFFENGQVWFPDTEWAKIVRDQLREFPYGAHDDHVDAAVMACLFLRDIGEFLNFMDLEGDDDSPQYRKVKKGYWLKAS